MEFVGVFSLGGFVFLLGDNVREKFGVRRNKGRIPKDSTLETSIDFLETKIRTLKAIS